MWVLAKILAVITRHPRYFPEIKWSSKSWTHNVFRVYELIFGRRYGIKAEMTSYATPTGEVQYACHSWESVFALTEQYVRQYLATWKFVPFKIYIPLLQTPQGFPVFASPYIFAIAVDANTGAYHLTTVTISHTTTGSDMLMLVGANSTNASDPFVSLDYAGAALTAVNANANPHTTNWCYHYYKMAPATGANNVVLVSNNNWMSVLTYSGVSQTGFPDSKATNTAVGTTFTVTTTVVASNCWISMTCPGFNTDTTTAGTATTMRGTGVDSGRQQADSNGTVGTGSQSLEVVYNVSSTGYGSIVSFAPPGAGGGAVVYPNLLTLNVG